MPISLDPVQHAAVEHDGGPLLVTGAAGTGRSTVLVERWVRLASSVTAPHRVLLLVGSRDRARTLRDELPWRLPPRAIVEVPVHTWHALAYHLVTRYASVLGFDSAPVVLSTAEQWSVVRELLAQEAGGHWGAYAPSLGSAALVDEVADLCLRAAERLATDDELRACGTPAASFCVTYREHLRRTGKLDSPGVTQAAVRLLRSDEGVRTALHERFPHVLVDDADRLSPAQLALLAELNTGALVCTATPGFRWPLDVNVATVTLPTCHRCGDTVGSPAAALLAHDGVAAPASPAGGPGSAVVRTYSTVQAEVDAAARVLRGAQLEGIAYDRMAVILAQPGGYVPPLRRALEALGVPYNVVGGERRQSADPAVRGVLDLCRAALDPQCSDEVLCGVLSSPFVALETSVVRELRREAFRTGRAVRDVVSSSDACEGFRRLAAIVAADPAEPADVTFDRLFRQAGWTSVVAARRHRDARAAETIDALGSLGVAIARFVERRPGGTMLDYLATSAQAEVWIDTAPLRSRTGTGVAILTPSAARGEEWDVVCVLGVNEGQLARRHAQGIFDPWNDEPDDPATRDRATLLTAFTRARRRLVVSSSPGPSGRATPSGFLEEAFGVIPEASTSADAGPPLTLAEAAERLRHTLASESATVADKAAAACALARTTDESSWWRRDWTSPPSPLAPAGKLTTSYSRIGTYDNCPLQYVLKSVLGLDPETTYQMKFGSLVHKVFERSDAVSGDLGSWEEADALFKECFDQTDYPNLVFARTYWRSGREMIHRWWNMERTRGKTVATEYSFDDLDVDGHVIRGRIDRIAKLAGGLVLSDYKTSRTMLAWDEARQSLQLAIYYLAAKRYLSAEGEPRSMQLVYPAMEDFREPGTLARRTQRPEEAEDALVRLREILDLAVREEFSPSAEADCQWCHMRPLCPRWPEGRETGP